ncbi:glyoxal oxidase [Streptomyces apocyni]|uniref:glyoxal oxidase n=1 Tax=Streptomyces apocyni TaxID=2654677 RepID=UPI0012EA76E7|nr:glyoxal oxidase [Streptomyces apocyni]
MTGGLLISVPQQQAAAAPNLIKNPGFETPGADAGDMPECWSQEGWGDNDFDFAVVEDAHSGTKAMKVELTRRVDGDRKAMITGSEACAPQVTEDVQYDLSLWYKSTTPDTSVTLFRKDATDGWGYWTDLKTLPLSEGYAETSVRTPPIPPGTTQITWGVSVYGIGSVTTDDYVMEEVEAPAPPVDCDETPEECAGGTWEVLPIKNPVRSMHSVVLHNGKVLLIAGSGNDPTRFEAGTFDTVVYDPEDGSYTDVDTPADMFCAGHVQLSDGKVLVMSGTKGYEEPGTGVGYQGYKDSYIFDPETEAYTKTNDMNDGHWYPSATLMGNGDVLSFGGLREDSSGSVTADRWSAEENRWLSMNEVNQTWSFWGLYPAMHLMQDGRLFYSGSHVFGNGLPGTGASIYDYDANTITDVPGLQRKDERDQSASVLLPPAQDQKVMIMGGGNNASNPEANRLTDIIDLKEANPAYRNGPLLPQGKVDQGDGPVAQSGDQGKMYVSAVLLPDGNVLETGGALHDRADPVYSASLFDPQTETFAKVPADPEPRGYHSSAFLLPDGRVMTNGDNPGNGSWNHNVSVYTPPYLLKGDRPEITSLINNEWKYGDTQRITVDRPIVKASLIKPAAVTHSSDPNQRYVDLPLTVDGNNIDLNVTTNPNIAPPGWYMLFAVDANGVPSVAEWVKLGGPAALEVSSSHVHDFAGSPEMSAKTLPEKRESAPVSPTLSGCDRHYGTANVCVPTAFPKSVAATTAARCEWLDKHDYGRLKVNGKEDPLKLDPNGDGKACTKADLKQKPEKPQKPGKPEKPEKPEKERTR